MNRPRGLYAITPAEPVCGPSLAIRVEQAIRGGARMIQYREKSGSPEKRLREATELLAVCSAAGVPLIVNDDLDLAAQLGAAGVHLGRDDADPVTARRHLGPSAIIGISCYDRYERAQWAQEAGADYAAFGRFFPSTTKPTAVQASPELLRRARRELTLPLVAIGGITPENGRSLIEAGADMLAVVDAVFGQPDIRAAAESFTRLFTQGGCSP
ncbi:MAG: thiamine phosphate synthase [Pseudomonadota bacterium]|nr:thiamine phosphate synthase [Pseudomonadota bacterium]